MGATDPADVREAFASLARSLKRIAVFRHAADQHRSYLEPAFIALRDLLARAPSLTVALEPSALRYQDEVVYSEPARETGFCFRLHRDGVRTLTFRHGLLLDDLLALASIALPGAVEGAAREDAVTELWKLDLEHIAYSAITGYRMDEAGGDALSKNIAEVTARAQQALDRSMGDSFLETAPPLPLWAAEQRARRDPQDWTALGRRAALTILRIVDQDHAGWDLEALEEAFWRLIDEMAARGEAQSMAVALDRARKIEGSHAAEFRTAVGRTLADPRRLELAVKLGANERPSLLPAWLALLPPESGPDLLAVLPLGTTDTSRWLIAEAALARSKSCVSELDAALRQGTAPVVQALLSAAAPPARRGELALTATANSDLAVKLAAIPLLAADESAARLLGSLLAGPSRELRTAAAQALGGFATLAEPAAANLIAAMSRPQFAKLDRQEQTLFCRALGKLGSATGFTFLFERLARTPKGFFGKRKGEAGKLLAVQGLAEDTSQRSLRALEEALLPSRGHSAAVLAACRAAAQHVRAAARGGKTA